MFLCGENFSRMDQKLEVHMELVNPFYFIKLNSILSGNWFRRFSLVGEAMPQNPVFNSLTSK